MVGAVKFLSAHTTVHSVVFLNPQIELNISWGMNPSFSKKILEPWLNFWKNLRALGLSIISAAQQYSSEK